MKMKMKTKKIMSFFLALVMFMSYLPLKPIVSYADDANEKTFNINDGSVNITKSGTYRIEGTGHATSNTISVTGNNITATITLKNVNIDVSNQNQKAAFLAKNNDQSNVHLTIILEGTNSLKSSSNRAGLTWNNSDNDSKLEISGNGSLTATGGENGSGIGGAQGSVENITIAGGTVTATGGENGAGIGGAQGSGKNITITGGTVTATGGKNAAGIGGGNNDSGENITIAGGAVTATGGFQSAGIGGGGNGSSGKDIKITGGTVIATGGMYGAGIGGSDQGSGENITIAGGTVTATGGWLTAAGIGGGEGVSWSATKNFTITGGSVKVNRFGTPPTDGKGNNVYLVKLENQDSVNDVTVESGTGNAKTFKRAGNHPDGDNAFYLYLTGQEYKLVTSKGKYKAKWNSNTNAFTIIEFIKMVVKEQPKKLTYTEGDKLNLDGLVVTLTDIDNNPKDVPFEQFTGNNIATDLDNGTRLIAANHNRARVKLTYKNLSAYTDFLTVKAKYTVTYKDGVNGAAFQDQVKSDIVTGSDTPAFTGTPTRHGYVFAGWDSPVADTVTKDATYTATWKEDKNGDGVADEDQKYTVTYTDGVAGEEIFPDQKSSDILSGTDTPKFNNGATPTRDGYVFAGWDSPVAEKVTADATYTATWKEDTNHDGVADEDQKYTVTYTDGVAGEEIFPDQKTTDILSGTKTPAFTGTPTRRGYVFAGWTPQVASKVTADATYTATWKEDKNGDGVADEDQKYTVTDMIPMTGESASYAGLLAALGFSITGLAILRKKKMMKENNK